MCLKLHGVCIGYEGRGKLARLQEDLRSVSRCAQAPWISSVVPKKRPSQMQREIVLRALMLCAVGFECLRGWGRYKRKTALGCFRQRVGLFWVCQRWRQRCGLLGTVPLCLGGSKLHRRKTAALTAVSPSKTTLAMLKCVTQKNVQSYSCGCVASIMDLKIVEREAPTSLRLSVCSYHRARLTHVSSGTFLLERRGAERAAFMVSSREHWRTISVSSTPRTQRSGYTPACVIPPARPRCLCTRTQRHGHHVAAVCILFTI